LPASDPAAELALALVLSSPEGAVGVRRLRHHLGQSATRTAALERGTAALRAAVLELLAGDAATLTPQAREPLAATLTAMLAASEAARRRDGARGLGWLEHAAAGALLEARLADEAREVRAAAAWALTRLPRTDGHVAALRTHAKALLASPEGGDVVEGIWLAQWVLGQPHNSAWLGLPDAQLRRVAARLLARLDA
ncbi:MAG: hypothetical protein O2894_11315, partial [Planctomycetota bacterium]|nr:hypothetical protein [Planctomycetota bacterium]